MDPFGDRSLRSTVKPGARFFYIVFYAFVNKFV